MLFSKLAHLIKEKSQKNNFNDASDFFETLIFSLDRTSFLPLVTQIGSIPEDIPHDSSEEKLYTKVSDIVLAKCFAELNFKSLVLRERANSADVFVESKFHNYSLVADAKAFRLSRTAKNQKDFKVESMIHWRGDNNYSVLCCPYFQYPKNTSQIYGSALNGNISLFSWEYFSILLNNKIHETDKIDLRNLWLQSSLIAEKTTISDKNKCFLEEQNQAIQKIAKISSKEFDTYLLEFKDEIIKRGNNEIEYWKKTITDIESYTREKAIEKLISALKLNQKIKAIDKFIKYLETL